MPWREVSTVSLRTEFVTLASQPSANMAELCRRFGISRKTGYKVLARHEAEGVAGLVDRPRRPVNSPRRTSARLERLILELRTKHGWGGRKIRHRLLNLGHMDVPAASTVSAILSRHGCIDELGSGRHAPFERFERAAPNELWQMDFKGHFPTDAGRCHPLTVLDDHSRYSIALRSCANQQTHTVQEQLTTAFRRYGLPRQMLMDNGAPWNDRPAENLFTPLVLWLMRLNIEILHGRAHHPQTQGKDERFHRTLKGELLVHHRFKDLQHCQRLFDRWRDVYNFERPHESLDMQPPAKRYRMSVRRFPGTLAPIEYGPADTVRHVQADGIIHFKGKNFHVCQALRGYPVALRPGQTDGSYTVHFCRQIVGSIDLSHPDN
jgi:transposase InsO family protein